MGFICEFLKRRRVLREERERICTELRNEYRSVIKEIDSFLADDLLYIDPEVSAGLLKHMEETNRRIKNENGIRKSEDYADLIAQKEAAEHRSDAFKKEIPPHNKGAVNKHIEMNSKILFVEDKEFDAQQKECIVKDIHNHLVLSGAGTGKTMVIVGKVKYLLKAKNCDPRKILVLSFTNKTANELRERIQKETGEAVTACTFHKLGLETIRKTQNDPIKINAGNQSDFILRTMNRLSKDSDYYSRLLLYASEVEEKKYWAERNNNKEAENTNAILTKRGERVKSHGEKDIANFLYGNKINYVYESSYKADEDGTKYHPDFYLPDHAVYIEYYGIDRDGKVPEFFSSRDGKTPSETYAEGMRWKEELHKNKGTKLVEVYAYERMERTLLGNLREKLTEKGVKFPERSETEIDDSTLSSIASVFESLLNKIKSKNLTIGDVRDLAGNGGQNLEENKLALSLFEPIFNEYQSMLRERGEIDYKDMINAAAECVRGREHIHNYDYVLIDEYQDISDARFGLLKEMRRIKDFDLFAVGDDWQSIYGFSGSNLKLLYDFDDYWGIAERSKVETTYRFPEKLIDLSSRFIMKNLRQIPKELKASTEGELELLEIRESDERKAMRSLIDRLEKLPEGSTVFFLGRYLIDKNALLYNTKIEFDQATMKAKLAGREDLEITFSTVHTSKGLQADCVVIMNNKDDLFGFPSRVADPSIVSLLDGNFEDFPFSEERRVYYVAMTRAKKMLVFLTLDGKISPFAKEILEKDPGMFEKNYIKVCPSCGGRLVLRKGDYGEFLGCSNYHLQNCRYKEKIA